jgi:hypothetical protein
MISSGTNERIQDIIWKMPLTMAFRLLAISYSMQTGEKVLDHRERHVIRKQQEAFTELTTNE